MEIRIEFQGVDEVVRLLRQLPEELLIKHGRKALQDAAHTIVSAVQSRIPSATGLARASIGTSKVKYYPQSRTLFAAIEPRKGFRRIVTASQASGYAGNVRHRIRSRKTTSVTASFGRVQNPRKYMHLIEKGRKAIVPTKKRALHSALDIENRFFVKAAATTAHPVFAPAASAVARAVELAVEAELERGCQEFSRST